MLVKISISKMISFVIKLYFVAFILKYVIKTNAAPSPTTYPTINPAVGIGVYKTAGKYPLLIPAGKMNDRLFCQLI